MCTYPEGKLGKTNTHATVLVLSRVACIEIVSHLINSARRRVDSNVPGRARKRHGYHAVQTTAPH